MSHRLSFLAYALIAVLLLWGLAYYLLGNSNTPSKVNEKPISTSPPTVLSSDLSSTNE